jgi:hypothetical protein
MKKYLLIAVLATVSSFALAAPTTTGPEVSKAQQDTVYKDYWGRGGWTRCSRCYR